MSIWEKLKAWYKWEGGSRFVDQVALLPILSAMPDAEAAGEDATAEEGAAVKSKAAQAAGAEASAIRSVDDVLADPKLLAGCGNSVEFEPAGRPAREIARFVATT